ncbi:MAG: hypothetical protein QME94_00115 [Anaerolineae bacterium]|nr:hypothetical protein [Anaerolineae bacterium]
MRRHTRLLLWLSALVLALVLLWRSVRIVVVVRVGWLQLGALLILLTVAIYLLLAAILKRLGWRT